MVVAIAVVVAVTVLTPFFVPSVASVFAFSFVVSRKAVVVVLFSDLDAIALGPLRVLLDKRSAATDNRR